MNTEVLQVAEPVTEARMGKGGRTCSDSSLKLHSVTDSSVCVANDQINKPPLKCFMFRFSPIILLDRKSPDLLFASAAPMWLVKTITLPMDEVVFAAFRCTSCLHYFDSLPTSAHLSGLWLIAGICHTHTFCGI